MRALFILLLILITVSFAEEFNRHSISIAFMPYPEAYRYPDVAYEYSFTKNDAIGISTTLAVVNRFAYTRKIGYFCLAAGIGYASGNLDIENATPLYTATAEYRQSFGDNFYTKLVAGALFANDLPENMSWVPILQVGFGYGF